MSPTDLIKQGGSAASVSVLIAVLFGGSYAAGADEVLEGPLTIHQIVADPVDPDRFYAVTSNMGVLASVDGGRRWAHANQGMKSFTHHALSAIAPAGGDAPVLLAGGWGGGVSISRDRAATWSERNGDLANTAIDALAVDPADNGRWYAATSTGLSRSSDGGAHWEPFGQGLPPLSEAVGYKTLAVEPSPSGRIWLGTEGGLFRRERTGSRWIRDPELGSARVTAVACDPRDGRVFVGTIKQGIHVKNGRAWRRVGDLNWFVSRVVPDPRDPARVYAATRGSGVFASSDGGSTWSPLGAGALDPDVRSLAVHPADPSRLVAGTTAAGWYYSHDRGATWRAAERVAPLTMSQIVAMLDVGVARATPTVPPAFAKCNRCHGWTAERLNAKHTYWRMPPNARDWAATVDRMAKRAQLTPEERAAILRFLTAYSRAVGP
ncbi:MAG: WD40/YVTN/BNR-like repeat-containing protein [Nitrospirota bacterium]